jgi:hypothetical protein
VVSYYDILGLSPSATALEIRAAYRQLAFDLHPDRNAGNPNADAMLCEINEAYRVLSDPTLRSEYDDLFFPHAPKSREPLSVSEGNLIRSTLHEFVWLLLPLTGAWTVVFLEELFFPIFPYSTHLIAILCSGIFGGAVAGSACRQLGLGRREASAAGLLAGMVLGILCFAPEGDFYAFLLVVKLCLGSAVGGTLAGLLSAKLGGHLADRRRANSLIYVVPAAVFSGAVVGWLIALGLAHQLSEDILFELLSTELPVNFTFLLVLLASLSTAVGATLMALVVSLRRQGHP